jgi:hypothetical protein
LSWTLQVLWPGEPEIPKSFDMRIGGTINSESAISHPREASLFGGFHEQSVVLGLFFLPAPAQSKLSGVHVSDIETDPCPSRV